MTQQTPDKNTQPPRPAKPSWHLNDVMLAVIVTLSLIGIIVNKFTPQDAFVYWLLMLILSGVAAIVTGWWEAREYGYVKGHTGAELRKIQIYHWGGALAIALSLPLLMQTNRIDNESASLIVLLILAQTLFQDGIRIGWRFSLAGTYLGATALVEAYTSYYIYIMLPVAIALIYLNLGGGEALPPPAAPPVPAGRGHQQLPRQAPAALPPGSGQGEEE